MRIVIDMQGAQTNSRFRGIGRYVISMAKVLLQRPSEHEIFLVCNAMMPESIAEVHQQFGDLIQNENILLWSGPGPVRDDDEHNTWRRRVAQECYKTFLQDVQTDLLFIPSYFEGFYENAVTCVAEPEFGFSTCAVIFDLIPLHNADRYLIDPVYARHYQRKLQEVQRAAGALTISEFSRTEALESLSFTPNQVVNTYLGADARFRPLPKDLVQHQARLHVFGIHQPFVLYAGGSDERKNLPRLIEAFAMLPRAMRQSHQLVLVGRFRDIDQQHLQRLADELGLASTAVCFTAFIADDTLIALYNMCTLFVFPSWHEGFGLPVLEAMACGAPAIAANCSSLPEVLAHPKALFDPFDVADMSRKMSEVLANPALRAELIAHGLMRVQQFSWDASATIALAKFNQILRQQPVKAAANSAAWALDMRAHYEKLIERIGALPIGPDSVSDQDLRQVARSIEINQAEARRVCRRVRLPEQSEWCVATVELAQALIEIGQRITTQLDAADTVLVYPLESDWSVLSAAADQVQIACGLCLNQTAVPEAWVDNLNQNVRGVVAPSRFIRKLIIDAGVHVPIAVSPEALDAWMHASASDGSLPVKNNYRFLCEISDIKNDGFDVLLDVFGDAFAGADEVSLIVLVDQQTRSEVQAYIDAWRSLGPLHADVVVLLVTDEPMRKAAYEQAHCLVAPSRFADVGLPVARAVALGLPVLTTGWGGQTESTSTATARFIDYHFVGDMGSVLTKDSRSKLNSSGFDVYCAEPDRAHLAELMRQQFAGKGLEISRPPAVPWRSWSDSAIELNQWARLWSSGPIVRPPRIGWVSTWNARCGIASYSEHLTECMTDDVVIFAPRRVERLSVDADHVVRCWDHADKGLEELGAALALHGIDTLVVQFNYGFFDFPALAEFLKLQAARRIKLVMVLHSTTDPVHVPERKLKTLIPVFKLCHRVLVHSVGDLNHLKTMGLVENVTLFPHGVKQVLSSLNLAASREGIGNGEEDFLIASYGFFLPHKGLLELIEAVGLMRAQGCKVSLRMVNAQYPNPESQKLVQQAHAMVEQLGLKENVQLITDYLADEESAALMQQADLIVYPYQETGESASGAVRSGLAVGRPVAVTPLAIFDDVDAAVFRLPGFTAEALASGLQNLMVELRAQEAETQDKRDAAKAWCLAHQYPKLAARLAGILKAELSPQIKVESVSWPHIP